MILHRKWRPTVATVVVLALAIAAYIQSATPALDLADMNYPFDSDHGKLEDVPRSIRSFDEKTVDVEGRMIPMDQAENIHRFALIPEDASAGVHSCWGGPVPTVQTTLVANSVHGVSYTPGRIKISGQLHVRLTTDDGYIISLYDMNVEQICPAYTGPFARWPWFIIGGIPSIAVLELLRRAFKQCRLRLAGHCTRCGYDLRATTMLCPECGLQTPVRLEPAESLPD